MPSALYTSKLRVLVSCHLPVKRVLSNSTSLSGEHEDIDTMIAEIAKIASEISFRFFIF